MLDYQIFFDGSEYYHGNVYLLMLAVATAIAVGISIAIYVWKKLHDNKVMKYEFITIIAHKFRTPLTHLKWISEELLSSELASKNKEDITDIRNSTDRLIGLAGTLLELANTDNESVALYKFERIPICEFVKDIASKYKDAFHGKNIFFTVRCEREDIFANIDRARMEFVISTLLENSLNYTPIGRNVDVVVTATWRKAIISVIDTGIGIDQHDLPHIFKKFQRAANARKVDTEGVGVGLYLAQSIVRRHRGRIEVSSEGIDRGTTFRVVIPRGRK